MTAKKFRIGVIASLGFLLGCSKHSSPSFIYMPDMYWHPGTQAQEVGQRPPVPGTIARNVDNLPADLTLEEAGKLYKNPLSRSQEVLARGQEVFNRYCIVCHGPAGMGDGYVVPKYPRPPSLQSEKIQKYADGNIYYVISRGQNLMPSYAGQISKADRWAIIHYVRALQRSKNPTAQDMKALSL